MKMKSEDVYADLAENVEIGCDTSNYKLRVPLPIGKKQKMIGLVKNESSRRMLKEFASLRSKMYSYLTDDGYTEKKTKGTRKCVVKCKIKFEDYKNCLKNNETTLTSQQRFRSETHNVFTEKNNKIALSANDDKRLQMLDGVKSIHMAQVLEECSKQNC